MTSAEPTPIETKLTLPDKPSIAVLPFQNMSGDPEQEYFADGMVEEIITALSRIRWLFVIARNSSFIYKGRSVDVRQVGRELGVRYVLEGSVRRAGNRVRITGQLIDATLDAHLWADRFDGSLETSSSCRKKWLSVSPASSSPRCRRPKFVVLSSARRRTRPLMIFIYAPCRMLSLGGSREPSRRSTSWERRPSAIHTTVSHSFWRHDATKISMSMAGMTIQKRTTAKASISLEERFTVLVTTHLSSEIRHTFSPILAKTSMSP